MLTITKAFQILWNYLRFWSKSTDNWNAVSLRSPRGLSVRLYICLSMCVFRGRPVITCVLMGVGSCGCGVGWLWY